MLTLGKVKHIIVRRVSEIYEGRRYGATLARAETPTWSWSYQHAVLLCLYTQQQAVVKCQIEGATSGNKFHFVAASCFNSAR